MTSVSWQCGGNRLSHHHDQRPGRGRMGGGRHRGWGCHARNVIIHVKIALNLLIHSNLRNLAQPTFPFFPILTKSSLFSQILPYSYKFFLILTNSSLFSQILSYSHKFFLILTYSSLFSQILPYFQKFFIIFTNSLLFSQILSYYTRCNDNIWWQDNPYPWHSPKLWDIESLENWTPRSRIILFDPIIFLRLKKGGGGQPCLAQTTALSPLFLEYF